MIRAGIVGAAGYTAGELIRILLNHPETEIAWAQSSSHAGCRLWEVHTGLFGETEMAFCDSADLDSTDVVFLCSGHGRSREFWAGHRRPEGLKVIDLAQDFRDESYGYIYGLPEINSGRIKDACLIANPGCFATAIQLALLPLASEGLLSGDVSINAITGSTGAGVKPSPTTHFSWRSGNVSVYKAFEHQHLTEIGMNVHKLQPEFTGGLDFIPVRGDFTRGILSTLHTACPLSQEDATALYTDFYKDAAFTFVFPGNVDLKQVVNTNKCLISLEKHSDKLVVTSVIDNLLKGASGQAVQNMNLMFGLPEKAGLNLKASAF